MRPDLINPSVLAYLGDSVFELLVRDYLVRESGLAKTHEIQKEAIKYVSAKGQCSFVTKLIEENKLTDDELEIFYRGRNHKSNSHPKNTDIITYKYATGFEAIIGYLYLKNDYKRIEEIGELLCTYMVKM